MPGGNEVGAAAALCRPAARSRSEVMGRVLFLAVSILSPGLSAVAWGVADDPKGKPEGARSRLTAGNVEKIKNGKGKMTEAEVVAILGPASRVAVPENVDVELEMIWEEKAQIRIKFKKGKASDLEGQFSEHLRSKTINLERFKKLKKGITEKEAEKVLGPANVGSSPERGIRYLTWEKFNLVKVQFKGGKVSGHLQMRSLND
jgi:hypothetical protein